MTSAETVTSVEAPPAVGTDTPRGDGGRTARGASEAASAAVDVLLADAAVDRRVPFVSPGPALRVAAGLARRPLGTARRVASLGAELTRVAAGRSELRPSRRDRRFADPAWESSWLFGRLMQSHLAVEEAGDALISEASLDWARERQARLAASNVLDALAPSNYAWSNPAVIKETVNQGGVNLARGARRFAEDFPNLPATVDTTKFSVGENLAATKGSVVLRTDVFELIQYAPQTKDVREVPLLFAPPTINKYYILDLAPGRSMVEWLLRQGQQVFAISWRNPDVDQGHFDLDTYAAAVLEARGAVAAITGQPAVHVNGACSGGMIAAGALGHLAAEDRLGEIATLTLMVVALDNERAGTAAAFAGRDVAAAAVAESARRGYLDGRALAGVFTWLRPNDLVWNYVVNNYLMGKAPPAFDVLYWNQDGVRLAAGVHRDFIRIGLENAFAEPGALEVLGTPVDLGAVDLDSYVVAGLTDHIIPWENAYSSTQLLGGSARFVLATSGHIQTLVNPPAPDSRATYRLTDDPPPDPEGWARSAPTQPGSWWPDYDEWLAVRSGELKPAPKRLGGAASRLRRRRRAHTFTQLERSAMTTQSLPYAHLGEALATDYFQVREPFTDEQWEHFTTTRRFVDEEVLPAINDYWEAAELPWPLMRRPPLAVRVGRAQARRGGVRRGSDLQQGARPVREAPLQPSARPGAPRPHALRDHRHAAVLHAARTPGGGRAAHRHDRRAGEVHQQTQGTRGDRRRARHAGRQRPPAGEPRDPPHGRRRGHSHL